MAPKMVLRTYEDYERSRGDLSGMFSLLADAFAIKRVLYPGSYIHLSPSFIFPSVVYVDTDKRAKKFFADRLSVDALVQRRKQYDGRPEINFHHADYATDLGGPDESFDLLVSLYAGLNTRLHRCHCRKGRSRALTRHRRGCSGRDLAN
jgi:hypothetical protein